MEDEKKPRFKPVILNEAKSRFYAPNLLAQNILLKGLADGITDVDELKRLAGLKSATEVYRTLDKMSIRKEYHEALGRSGIGFDYLLKNIKDIIEWSKSDSVKLQAIQTLMRSIGVDKYEDAQVQTKSWEEAVIQAVEKAEDTKRLLGDNAITDDDIDINVDYEVHEPEITKTEEDIRNADDDAGKKLYEE